MNKVIDWAIHVIFSLFLPISSFSEEYHPQSEKWNKFIKIFHNQCIKLSNIWLDLNSAFINQISFSENVMLYSCAVCNHTFSQGNITLPSGSGRNMLVTVFECFTLIFRAKKHQHFRYLPMKSTVLINIWLGMYKQNNHKIFWVFRARSLNKS